MTDPEILHDESPADGDPGARRIERRRARRMPATGARGAGRVRVEGRMLPAQIADESAAGIGVVVADDSLFEVGQTLLVEIGADWFEARIVRLTPCDDYDESSPRGEARVHLGLVRVRAVDPAEVEPEEVDWLSWEGFKSLAVPLAPLGRPIAGTVAALLGALAVGGIVYLTAEHSAPTLEDVAQRPGGGTIKIVKQVGRAASGPSVQIIEKNARPVGPAVDGKRGDPKAAVGTDSKPAARPADPLSALAVSAPRSHAAILRVPRHVARHVRPELFLEPQIKALLNLTAEQLAALEGVFAETRTAAGELATGAGGVLAGETATAEAQTEALVEQGRRALAVLNEEQRRVLVGHLAARHADEAPAVAPAAPADPSTKRQPSGDLQAATGRRTA